ncbi:MAG: zinc-ribbon domain-containing protein [Rhodospirillales bacterium]|nr:zinc-ribbon domain-containing protein [Rhodospirillales bacterium]
MIIACPRCTASYAVEDRAFGPNPRIVQCSACNERWTQHPDGRTTNAATALEMHDPDERRESPEFPEDDEPGAEFAAATGEPPWQESEDDDAPSEPSVPAAKDRAPDTAPGAGGVAFDVTPEQPRDGSGGADDGAATAGGTEVEDVQTAQDTQADTATDVAGETARAPDGEGSASKAPANKAPAKARGGKTANVPLYRRTSVIASVSAIATTITLSALLIVLRAPIIAALPATERAYDALGLTSNDLGAGLEIRQVVGSRERNGGDDVLVVNGIVTNIGNARVPLPAVRIGLYGESDDELQVVTVPNPRESVAPGETVPFEAKFSPPNPEARRIRVGFAEPHP